MDASTSAGWPVSAPARAPVMAVGVPSGMMADEGVEGSAAAWGAALSAGALAAGLAALDSLCSGALRRFMMVVTRTAFCGGKKNFNKLLQAEGTPHIGVPKLSRTATVELCDGGPPERENRTYLPFCSGKVLLYLCTHIFFDVLI